MTIRHRRLVAAFAVIALSGTMTAAGAEAPPPITCAPSTPPRDALHKHVKLSAAPNASFSVGSGDNASLLQPVNSAVGISYGVSYTNSWNDDNQALTLKYQHSFANDVDPHALTTLKNAFNVEAINAQSETFAAVREWDTSETALLLTLANTYRHAGPSIVQQAKFAPTSGYHLTTLTPDYSFGPTFLQCPAGPTHRWDVAVAAALGSHRTAPDAATGATDVASKVSYQFSPTYSFPLNRNGSVYGAINYSNNVRYFDGLQQPVHFNDYDLGVVWTPNRTIQYEIHLNSLTQNNPGQALSAPTSFSHANIDFKMTVSGLP